MILVNMVITFMRSHWKKIFVVLLRPIRALSTFLRNISEAINKALNTLSANKKAERHEKEVQAGVRALFVSRNFLDNQRNSARVKIIIIVMLETVSFSTTYRGLFQSLSALGRTIPLFLAAVIQIGVVYLSTTIGFAHTARSKWVLTVMFVGASIFFSYIGFSESALPYEKYVEDRYSAYVNAYLKTKDAAIAATERWIDATAVIEGKYEQVEQLLGIAKTRYSDDELKTAEAQVDFYTNKVVTTSLEQPKYTKKLPSGDVVVLGGGHKIVSIPDPDAAKPLNEADKHLQKIREGRVLIENISAMVEGRYSLDNVKSLMSRQVEATNILPDFVKMSTALKAVEHASNELANQLGEENIALDLNEIREEWKGAHKVAKLPEIATYSEILQMWDEAQMEIQPHSDLLDIILNEATKALPSDLKKIADRQVSETYMAVQGLTQLKNDIGLDEFENAYEAYELESPILYALSGLMPLSWSGIFSAILALFNDLFALVTGIFIEEKQLNLANIRDLTPAKQRRFMFRSLEAVVVPMIQNRLTMKENLDDECFAMELQKIIEEFLGHFCLEPRLIAEGYTRSATGTSPGGYENLTSLLLRLGMLKTVSADEFDLLSRTVKKTTSDRLLLTSRGEAWLIELQGSAADSYLLK